MKEVQPDVTYRYNKNVPLLKRSRRRGTVRKRMSPSWRCVAAARKAALRTETCPSSARAPNGGGGGGALHEVRCSGVRRRRAIATVLHPVPSGGERAAQKVKKMLVGRARACAQRHAAARLYAKRTRR